MSVSCYYTTRGLGYVFRYLCYKIYPYRFKCISRESARWVIGLTDILGAMVTHVGMQRASVMM